MFQAKATFSRKDLGELRGADPEPPGKGPEGIKGVRVSAAVELFLNLVEGAHGVHGRGIPRFGEPGQLILKQCFKTRNSPDFLGFSREIEYVRKGNGFDP